MNEKLNIQDLIEWLAERHGMSRKNADSFVKEFFSLIEESLERDKYVKIKGLGTFKLIDVESRESVKVNSGERFEIEGHTKVSFTPEQLLKDAVNRPFAHFEAVPLKNEALLENTPIEERDEEEKEGDEKEEKAQEDLPNTPTESDMLSGVSEEPKPEEISDDKDEKAQEDLPNDLTGPKSEENLYEKAEEETSEYDASEEEMKETESASTEREPISETDEPMETDNLSVNEPAVPLNQEEPDEKAENEPKVEGEAEEEKETDPEDGEKTETVVPEEELFDEKNIPLQGKDNTIRYFIGIVIFIIILCVAAIIYIYYPDLLDKKQDYTEDREMISQQKKDAAESAEYLKLIDSLLTARDSIDLARDSAQRVTEVDTTWQKQQAGTTALQQQKEAPKQTSSKETKKPAKAEQPEKTAHESAAYVPDSTNYIIVGTEADYTIKAGETLTRVALRFYGTKALYPYIVKHNPGVIKNPNNVPSGTRIRIPKLEKKD